MKVGLKLKLCELELPASANTGTCSHNKLLASVEMQHFIMKQRYIDCTIHTIHLPIQVLKCVPFSWTCVLPIQRDLNDLLHFNEDLVGSYPKVL